MRIGFVLLMAALLTVATGVWAGAPQADNGSQIWATLNSAAPDLNRDDADDDSVHYTYGFEDGWGGWTTVDLTDIDARWHLTDANAFEGNSWWCGDDELAGYDDHWLQYIDTPALDFRQYQGQAVSLEFKLFYASEEPAGAAAPYNAWDGSNMWVSTDGGNNWVVLNPTTPRYTNTSLFSFGDIWGMGANIPGWCGRSNGWVDGRVDLSAYAGRQNIVIRWAFASDDGWCTADDADYYGVMLDNIRLFANNNDILVNNGDGEGDADELICRNGSEAAGDYWELTDDDAHTGDFSAHCPVQPGLVNALVSCPLEIPDNPWYTWFDFWIHADARNFSPDGDNSLDDYYYVEYSTNQVVWERIFHDYGRSADWWDDWHYYGPDTSYDGGHDAEWKGKLNLTQFGGQTIWLRWVAKFDEVMGQNEGTGFWIDDFRLNIIARHERDVAVDWVDIPHPVALGFRTRCSMQVTNNGMLDMDQVQHFYRIDDRDPVPVMPWEGLDSDSTETFYFTFNDRALTMLPFAGVVNITGSVFGAQDEEGANDEFAVNNVTIYPENVWVLGYDNRTNPFAFRFEEGHGPAVLFTPEDDNIDGEFDIKALRVLWNGLQVAETDVDMHFLENNGGEPGDEIFGATVTVTSDNSNPKVHVIDLADVEELQGMSDDFWIWFELTNEDNIPSPTGDNAHPGSAGHYFDYDGSTLVEWDREFIINPVLMPAGAEGAGLVAGRDTIDFGIIPPRDALIIPFTVFNAGLETAMITSVRVSGDCFRADSLVQMPAYLDIADYMPGWVSFRPLAERAYQGSLTVRTSDGDTVGIQLIGVGDYFAAPEDPTAVPVQFGFGEIFPNPFNMQTVIPFNLPQAGFATMTIFDINGRSVAVPVAKEFSAGSHNVEFDGEGLAAGVYWCRLDFGNRAAVTKLALVK